MADNPYLISPWVPETDIRRLKILGKCAEELTECSTAIIRAIIQGFDEVEPVTKKPNRQWIMEEIADAKATIEMLENFFDLPEDFIEQRREMKMERLAKWLSMMPKQEPARERRESRHEEIGRLLRDQMTETNVMLRTCPHCAQAHGQHTDNCLRR